MTDWIWILKHKVLGRSRYYEQPVMDRLKQIRGGIFVDIGANVGRYSSRLARNFKQVHAFEPNPRYLPALGVSVPENVTVHPCALSDTEGSTLLFLNAAGHGGSADTILKEFVYNPADNPLAARRFTGVETESIRVLCTRFDSLFQDDTVDLVKIDVEGAEFLVLAGMADSLKRSRVHNIVVELHDSNQAGPLHALFAGYGYYSYWLDSTHLFAHSHEGLINRRKP